MLDKMPASRLLLAPFYSSRMIWKLLILPKEDPMQSDVDDEDRPPCPFCESMHDCAHLLLSIDQVFRTACGGFLMEAFNALWQGVFEANEDDQEFDEGEKFDALIERVTELADAQREYEFEGGPGMSTTYTLLYVSSDIQREKALKAFAGPDTA